MSTFIVLYRNILLLYNEKSIMGNVIEVFLCIRLR
jgi:hypothetical protein